MNTVEKGDEAQPMTKQAFNEALWEQFSAAPEGHLKNASEQTSKYVKRQLREDGFARLIFDFETVSDSDLTKYPDTELPVVVGEMEPDSPGAVTVPFNDGPVGSPFRGDNFVTYFSKITTPEFYKNIDELRTYKMDLRGVVSDNAIKDISRVEDGRLITTVDGIVGPNNGVGDSGVRQSFQLSGGITRTTYKETLKHLGRRNLPNGVFLVNTNTATEFVGWDRSEIGGDLAERIFNDGVSAIEKAKILGVRHIMTIKRDLVPDNFVYQFAPQGYLGKAYVLRDVTMYVKKERDIIRFSAEEKIGMTIANVNAVGKCEFVA
jgi:hypothetical protein